MSKMPRLAEFRAGRPSIQNVVEELSGASTGRVTPLTTTPRIVTNSRGFGALHLHHMLYANGAPFPHRPIVVRGALKGGGGSSSNRIVFRRGGGGGASTSSSSMAEVERHLLQSYWEKIRQPAAAASSASSPFCTQWQPLREKEGHDGGEGGQDTSAETFALGFAVGQALGCDWLRGVWPASSSGSSAAQDGTSSLGPLTTRGNGGDISNNHNYQKDRSNGSSAHVSAAVPSSGIAEPWRMGVALDPTLRVAATEQFHPYLLDSHPPQQKESGDDHQQRSASSSPSTPQPQPQYFQHPESESFLLPATRLLLRVYVPQDAVRMCQRKNQERLQRQVTSGVRGTFGTELADAYGLDKAFHDVRIGPGDVAYVPRGWRYALFRAHRRMLRDTLRASPAPSQSPTFPPSTLQRVSPPTSSSINSVPFVEEEAADDGASREDLHRAADPASPPATDLGPPVPLPGANDVVGGEGGAVASVDGGGSAVAFARRSLREARHPIHRYMHPTSTAGTDTMNDNSERYHERYVAEMAPSGGGSGRGRGGRTERTGYMTATTTRPTPVVRMQHPLQVFHGDEEGDTTSSSGRVIPKLRLRFSKKQLQRMRKMTPTRRTRGAFSTTVIESGSSGSSNIQTQSPPSSQPQQRPPRRTSDRWGLLSRVKQLSAASITISPNALDAAVGMGAGVEDTTASTTTTSAATTTASTDSSSVLHASSELPPIQSAATPSVDEDASPEAEDGEPGYDDADADDGDYDDLYVAVDCFRAAYRPFPRLSPEQERLYIPTDYVASVKDFYDQGKGNNPLKQYVH